MFKKLTAAQKIILFIIAALALLFLIAQFNEGFNSFTPGKSKYYEVPKLDSRSDSSNTQKP